MSAAPYLLRLALALALPPLLGWLATRLLAGRALELNRLERLALCWMLGWGVLTLGMFAVGEAGVVTPWRPAALAALWLALAALLGLLNVLLARGGRAVAAAPRVGDHQGRGRPWWRLALRAGAIALVAAQSTVALVHALAWPVNGEDAWSIWAFKARIFYLSQTIPSGYFHDASKLFSHPDYPLLAPLAETWLYGWLGRVDDWAVLLLGPPFFLCLLAVVAGALRRAYGPTAGLLGAVVLVCIPFVITWASMGDADMPLTCAAAGSAAMLWRWLRGEAGWRALALSGVLAGTAAWTKKEGAILLVLTALVVALAAWRSQPTTGAEKTRRALGSVTVFLVAALALAAPWLLFTATRRPLTRDFLPVTTTTLLAHLDRLPTIASYIVLHMLYVQRWNVLWLLAVPVLALGWRRLCRDRALAYLLLLLALQVASDGALFIFSDWQPFTYHLATALDRLLLHALPVLVMLVLGLAVERRGSASGSARAPLHAEVLDGATPASPAPTLPRSA